MAEEPCRFVAPIPTFPRIAGEGVWIPIAPERVPISALQGERSDFHVEKEVRIFALPGKEFGFRHCAGKCLGFAVAREGVRILRIAGRSVNSL
jgi:hypothetical protein